MKKFAVLCCVICLSLFSSSIFADLKILDTAEAFQQAINAAPVNIPVLVQFSAYWCSPCQQLKQTMIDIAPEYTDDQVLLYYVDAYTNASLQTYLKGGYPTVRVFRGGVLQDAYFLGSKPADFVRDFINGLIGRVKTRVNAELKILNSLEDFNAIIKDSQTPVVVQFSAYWCDPCQRLKEKLRVIAPTYSAEQIQICYIDAYVITALKPYLKGGYPTVRVFVHGTVLEQPYLLGDQIEDDIRKFLDSVITMPFSPVMAPVNER